MITAREAITLRNRIASMEDDVVAEVCANILISIAGGFRYCYTPPLTPKLTTQLEEAGYKIGSDEGRTTISW